MALVVKDRVRETSTTTGTGTLTLNGAVTGFQSFSVIGDGNTTYYTIVDAGTGAWEVGIGTYSSAGTSLSRDTVLESSNSGSLVNFGSNLKDVFVTYPAERSIYTDAAGTAITPATASVLGVASGGTGQSTYTNGQLLIGNTTGNTLTKATLTAGTGISITNGTGSISIAATNNGDVVGPASSTDNAVARFDLTTGKIIQNSGVIIDDSNNITGVVGQTMSGNLTLNGTAQRILGDFSNATFANRALLQTSTTNGGTFVGAIPNGSGASTSFQVFGSSDANNSSRGQFTINATEVRLISDLTGTGTYLPMTFYTGGSERMRIDTSGNVGIGTTNTFAGSKLSVEQGVVARASTAGLTPYLQLYNSNAGSNLKTWRLGGLSDGALVIDTVNDAYSASTERMRINSSGNVGIGATSISTKLHLYGAGTTSANYTNGDAVGCTLLLQDTGGVGNNGGQLLFGAFQGIFAGIKGLITNGTGPAGDLVFQTRNTSGNVNERMRIDYLGNVGIGTSSTGMNSAGLPLVVGSGSGNTGMTIYSGNASAGSIHFGDAVSTGVDSYRGYINYAHNTNSMQFGTDATERMRITSGGIVCINRNAPESTERLSVNGGIRCESTVVIDNNGDVNEGGEIGLLGGTSYTSFDKAIDVFQADLRIFGNGNWTASIFSTSATANLAVQGALSKGSGSFRIDHPLPELNETHNLVHSFVESPQADNIYRGKVELVAGRAEVNIDAVAGMTEGTFVLLNREVQCFTSNESDWDAVRGSVTGNILTIECQNSESTATISWLVIGERQDKHMYDTDWTDENGKVIVEPLKPPPQPVKDRYK